MMTYLKHVGGKKHSDLKTKTFEEIHVLYERLKRQDQNFVAIRSAEDERQIKELNKDTKKKRLKKRVVKETPREEDTAKVHAEQEVTEQDIKKRKSGHYLEITPKDIELILWGDLKIMMESSTEENDQELKDGTVIYMLVERRYPLSKELLQRMLDLGLEVEEESTAALQLVKRLEKIVKSSKARTRAKIVVSGDEEDVDDTSKLGNSMIEDVDQYAGVTLVQIDAEDQGSVAKVLADAARVHTYTRRRRTVSTSSGGISTASRLISTAKESVSIVGASMPVSTAGMVQESIPSPRATKDKGKAIMQESKQPKKIKKRVQIQMSLDEELAQKLHEEEQARFNEQSCLGEDCWELCIPDLVKRLEKIVKSSKARTRAKIVVSGDEEDVDDTSKLGNSMIEDVDQYAGVTLVQIDAEDQGSVAKVLADAARVHTYTRRRRTVSTSSGGISTASRLISTAKESVSIVGASMPVSTAGMVQESIPSPRATKDKGKAIMQESKQPKKIKKRVQIQMSLDEELAQKLHEEEQARFNAEQEVKINAEQEELLASEVTDDEANPSVSNVDWDDVQAQIQVDEDLAQRMLEKEKESLSITERERLLAELIDKRKKLQAA
ncbi:hypothetical protein Tco_0624757 [Tanacetum coccineum]|uniref:J domain-containing protein n=1 Tax=Tanacetum coccineum TaxID=301880 RepID=A0ABQ4WEW5_9ASTR